MMLMIAKGKITSILALLYCSMAAFDGQTMRYGVIFSMAIISIIVNHFISKMSLYTRARERKTCSSFLLGILSFPSSNVMRFKRSRKPHLCGICYYILFIWSLPLYIPIDSSFACQMAHQLERRQHPGIFPFTSPAKK